MKVRMPLVLRLLWDPIEALDLVDDEGKADYAKVIPVTVIYALLALVFVEKVPSIGIVLALLSASFGQSMFRSFLKARIVSEQATASVAYERRHTTIETRDVELQAEDTP